MFTRTWVESVSWEPLPLLTLKSLLRTLLHLQSRHCLLSSLQICHVENHVNSRPNDRTDMPTIYEPDNRRTNTPATRIDKTPCRYACEPTLPIRLRADLPTEPTLRWHRTAIYHRQTDSAAMPAITINDCACTPTINRPTDRRALRSTTIATQRSHRTATFLTNLLCLYFILFLINSILFLNFILFLINFILF